VGTGPPAPKERLRSGEYVRHMDIRVFDPKIKHQVGRYLLQSSLAALALFAILAIEGAHLSKAIVIAAIASTAFVLFITPNAPSARPRNVIGGHLLCLAIGSAFSLFSGAAIGHDILAEAPLLFDVGAALAVGLSFLAMATTDTEHALAAGTTLGVIANQFSLSLVLFVAIGVVALSLVHVALRRHLRDLR